MPAEIVAIGAPPYGGAYSVTVLLALPLATKKSLRASSASACGWFTPIAIVAGGPRVGCDVLGDVSGLTGDERVAGRVEDERLRIGDTVLNRDQRYVLSARVQRYRCWRSIRDGEQLPNVDVTLPVQSTPACAHGLAGCPGKHAFTRSVAVPPAYVTTVGSR